MSGRHSYTEGQLFASPGVVIRKSVIMKSRLPQHATDGFTASSAVRSVVINQRLLSVDDTHQSGKESHHETHSSRGSYI